MSEADLDTAALEAYLSAELDDEIVDVEVLHEALNLSLAVSTAERERAYVLRRPRNLRETNLVVDLDVEFQVLERLADTAVPAPEPVLHCEDASVFGDEFVVTTFLDGEAVPLGSDLPERFRNPAARRRLAEGLVDTLAEIHSLDPGPFADVCERQTPTEMVDRAMARLDNATSATGREVPELRAVGEWLREHAPAETATTLVHGDYRPGNVLFAGDDDPEIAGVLDWETAMLGDPLTELGYLLLRWRDDGDPTPSLDDLEARHADEAAIDHLRDVNEDGLAPFTNDPGTPTRRELVARYEAKTGSDVEHAEYYLAHAAFVLATVWEDLHRSRLAAGDDSTFPPLVDYVTTTARSFVDGEFRL
ncbi:phosphotransferase family protein [Halobacterium wangiae]|uniref:phosphotransferase family protein n=1 Tax=Halobacterium wangiae TaxID=2902623 RepID=UPI001E6368A7|nr:phosphotransferase family protein [Halobacterium wangiae]